MELFLKDPSLLSKCISKTTSSYRPQAPSWYLYRKTIEYKGDKFSNDFIELVYVTLSAWNMNTRRAKLATFEKFIKTIKNNKRIFKKLAKNKLQSLSKNKEIADNLEKLFLNLNLVRTKAALVTFSKTLHFFLPDLVVPIDRTFTLKYFKGGISSERSKQFELFMDIQKKYSEFSNKVKLEKFLDNKWNLNIPKVCDNVIIGYGLKHPKKR